MSLPTDGLPSRLAAIRAAHHWSQAELADRLGVHKTWVSKLERGDRDTDNLPVRDLFRLAAVLDVSPWALITGWEPDRPVDLDVAGVEKTTAGDVWAWANWEASLDAESVDAIAVWLRYSPFFRPGLEAEDLKAFSDRMARPVEVDLEDGRTVVDSRLDPELAALIEEFRLAAERIIEAKETK